MILRWLDYLEDLLWNLIYSISSSTILTPIDITIIFLISINVSTITVTIVLYHCCFVISDITIHDIFEVSWVPSYLPGAHYATSKHTANHDSPGQITQHCLTSGWCIIWSLLRYELGCPPFPGCNRGKWRFRLGYPNLKMVHNPGGDCYWEGGQPKIWKRKREGDIFL